MQAGLRTFVSASENLAAGAGDIPRLQMRIGINTGLVLLGEVGTTAEYTAVGDTVNLASRLQEMAPEGGILVSQETYIHVRDTVDPTPPGLEDVEAGKGDEVAFDGTGAFDKVGVVKWTWTFEEGGETVTLEGMQVEHVFEEAGEYKVTLTVADVEGNEATETFKVSVSGGAWVWAVVALVVFAAAFSAIILMRRSRG